MVKYRSNLICRGCGALVESCVCTYCKVDQNVIFINPSVLSKLKKSVLYIDHFMTREPMFMGYSLIPDPKVDFLETTSPTLYSIIEDMICGPANSSR